MDFMHLLLMRVVLKLFGDFLKRTTRTIAIGPSDHPFLELSVFLDVEAHLSSNFLIAAGWRPSPL
jgi:hypothetical protein